MPTSCWRSQQQRLPLAVPQLQTLRCLKRDTAWAGSTQASRRVKCYVGHCPLLDTMWATSTETSLKVSAYKSVMLVTVHTTWHNLGCINRNCTKSKCLQKCYVGHCPLLDTMWATSTETSWKFSAYPNGMLGTVHYLTQCGLHQQKLHEK
jgi:hypothetical protein